MLFRIYRNDGHKLASDFDLGDLEFVFGDRTICSRGNPRLLNMIYLSVVGLIDGLLNLRNGSKRFEFVGVDSSLILLFKRTRDTICVIYRKEKYAEISITDLLAAIDAGIDLFLLDKRNVLPSGASVFNDFTESRSALKAALATDAQM